MPDDDRTPPPDPELVAYLDGELPPDAARRVQDQLAADAAARREAEALKKTYDLLDHLPRPAPSATFASRTLTKLGTAPPAGSNATVAHTAVPSTPAAAVPSTARRFAWLGWAVAAVVAAGVGYLGHLLARPHLEAGTPPRTSEQVRLLERLPLYLGVDDLAFARRLDDPDLFADADAAPAAPAPEETFTATELSKLEELFKQFPPGRQEQLRRLDADVESADPPARDRLLGVIERYAVWLDRLPDTHRREVLNEPSPDERLDAVKRVRARQWRDGLPPAAREKLAAAEPDERDRLTADRKKREADRRAMWTAARRQWAELSAGQRPYPFTSDDLTKQVNEYVEKTLRPRLSPFERSELDELRATATAPGASVVAWWSYGWGIHRSIESHPPLPPAAPGGPMVTTVEELRRIDPNLTKTLAGGPKAVAKKPKDFLLRDLSGRWPDFALAVLEATKTEAVPKTPLGPSRPTEYPPAVAEFLRTTLAGKLVDPEPADLRGLEGKWPDHSRRLMELARKYDLSVPGVSLPGSPRQWADTYDPRRRK